MKRSGTAALLGWTNVGKSTLLNRLVGDKLAAVADVAQTTRHRILGVRNVIDRGQVAFVDTPGLHRPRFKLNRAMVQQARGTLTGVDLALLVIDAEHGLGPGDRQAAELLRRTSIPRIAVLNKIDRVRPKSKLLPIMATCSEELDLPEALPVSALTGEGCDGLLDRAIELLPEGPPMFPEDYLTDQTERTLAAEFVREQLLLRTAQELPHATAVLTERWEEREDGLVEIDATILVERESQKPIVVGKGGQMLKEIGSAARADLERMLGRRVFLRLWVRIRKDWRNDERVLRRLGLGA